jgi:hypothetical protein
MGSARRFQRAGGAAAYATGGKEKAPGENGCQAGTGAAKYHLRGAGEIARLAEVGVAGAVVEDRAVAILQRR